MNFDFDDVQYALQELARDLFTKESPPSRVRSLWDGEDYDRRVWKTMAGAGLVGVAVPEAFGGAGGSTTDLALVLEEAGRVALPDPYIDTACIAAIAISHGGDEATRARWLPAIAEGEALITVADTELASGSTPEPDAVLSFSNGGVVLDDGSAKTKLDVSEPDISALGRFAVACALNGVAMRELEMTTAYTKEREQFGKPVGSFQAVKHKLAEMHVAITSSRPAAWYSGYALWRRSDDAHEAAAVAKLAAVATEKKCNLEALQCHGGIGFTWESDLHIWLKAGMALRTRFGTEGLLRAEIAPNIIGS